MRVTEPYVLPRFREENVRLYAVRRKERVFRSSYRCGYKSARALGTPVALATTVAPAANASAHSVSARPPV